MSKTTVVVTGGAGFIGSHAVDALLSEGHRVVAVDDLSSGAARRVAPEAALEIVDITDPRSLDPVVDAARPGAIVHLAAQSSVTRSVAEPRLDCAANVLGTLNVLEAAKRHGAPVVFSSTGGALYGNDARIPTPEEAPPAPISPYGASKWAAEAYVLTWGLADRAPHAVCRLGNVYGPRQSPHGEAGVVAIFTYLLWRGHAPTLYGFGRPTRDYVHVEDVAQALLAAVGKPGIFNIATGLKTDVMQVFQMLQRAAGVSIEPVLAPLRPRELEQSCMDPSRAGRELGWRAAISLEDGLRSTYHALVEEFEAADSPPPGA
jgi:UDP-glucose 4-epimerase